MKRSIPALLGLAFVIAARAVSQDDPESATQALQFAADSPKSIVELQRFRRTTSLSWRTTAHATGTATLVDINPAVGSWFLLELDTGDGTTPRAYHLENVDPTHARVSLDEASGRGLLLRSPAGDRECLLWSDGEAAPLEEARRSGLPFAPLCAGALMVRNPVTGTYTHLEEVTNFLRDHVWGGDRIVTFVREEFYRDAFAEAGTEIHAPAVDELDSSASGPPPALLEESAAGEAIIPEHLGIDVGPSSRELRMGAWREVAGAKGIFVSAIRPQAIANPILKSYSVRASNLDSVEAAAVDFLVAFDLDQFELGFALGTDHPRLDWSGRELPEMHSDRLPGPDGVGTAAPLVRTGMLSPAVMGRAAATFAGGFKREHSAFHYGDLAHRNHGSHYGFIESGATFSKLQPGLATVYVLDDGSVGMKTWTTDDAPLLSRMRHARQNGVPLLEHTPGSAAGTPGELVSQWGAGNWSGSADEKLRTLRAGLCLRKSGARRFLIYGYFSTATPAAMVRVFQAYGCEYAMHLDMNALEHTYLALYTRQQGRLLVQHLIEGMAEVDRKGRSDLAPRFLGFPDDRDFFYLLRRPGL